MPGSHEFGIEWERRKAEARKRSADAAQEAATLRQESLRAQLLAPDGVEKLVESGRVPNFVGAYEGRDREMTFVTLCHVPPEGTQHGDTVRWISSAGAFYYCSPEGTVRGYADTLAFTPQEAAPLSARVQTALATLKT